MQNPHPFIIPRKRYVANLPRLLWAPRRQLLRLLALLRVQRAEVAASAEGGTEAWLARLARLAGEPWQARELRVVIAQHLI